MDNLTLKQGDLVKVLTSAGYLNMLGLSRGEVCLVAPLGDGKLGLKTSRGDVILVSGNGMLTELCDDISLHRCPVTLPIGQVKG